MPKRGLEAAPGQHAARSDSDRLVQTGASPPPVHRSSAFFACTTNLDATNGNARPDMPPESRPGWAMAFALGPLGLRDTPAEYLSAIHRLRALRRGHLGRAYPGLVQGLYGPFLAQLQQVVEPRRR